MKEPKRYFNGPLSAAVAWLTYLIRQKKVGIGGDDFTLTVGPRTSTRSLAQNKLYWKWLTVIARQMYLSGEQPLHDTEAWHLWFQRRLLGYETAILPDGEQVTILRSTTKLTTKEFYDYLEDIELFVGAESGIELPQPEDLYNEAMGRRSST